jgi:hypothetical protein
MEDEKYVFIQDVKEKKEIARSAKNKKNGSKSTKVTFPSDYLTRKEREKMNGECKTWNLNEFYTWAEFKEMPADIAAAYISTLNQKYHVSIRTISNELFHIADSTFHMHIRKHGIFPLLNIKRYFNNSSIVEEFRNAMKKEKETTADIFIPDGMAPGYCSDGTKVEDAIKETVDAANKKLIEDGLVSSSEVIADIHKKIDSPDTGFALDFSNNPDGEFKKIEESKDEREYLFFDSFSNRTFWATKYAVHNAIDKINSQIYRCPSVNDFYFILGLPPIEQGDTRGWRPAMKEYEFDPCIRVDKIDGKECITLDYLPYYLVHGINEFEKPDRTNDKPITRLNVTMNGIDSDRIADILSWFTGKDVMVTLIVQEKIGPDDLV